VQQLALANQAYQQREAAIQSVRQKEASVQAPLLAEAAAKGTQQRIESETFYRSIGYPEYAGKYAPFNVPEGYTPIILSPSQTAFLAATTGRAKPPEGQLDVTLVPKPNILLPELYSYASSVWSKQASEGFWTKPQPFYAGTAKTQGYPEYAGKYAPLDVSKLTVPEGYELEVQETTTPTGEKQLTAQWFPTIETQRKQAAAEQAQAHQQWLEKTTAPSITEQLEQYKGYTIGMGVGGFGLHEVHPLSFLGGMFRPIESVVYSVGQYYGAATPKMPPPVSIEKPASMIGTIVTEAMLSYLTSLAITKGAEAIQSGGKWLSEKASESETVRQIKYDIGAKWSELKESFTTPYSTEPEFRTGYEEESRSIGITSGLEKLSKTIRTQVEARQSIIDVPIPEGRTLTPEEAAPTGREGVRAYERLSESSILNTDVKGAVGQTTEGFDVKPSPQAAWTRAASYRQFDVGGMSQAQLEGLYGVERPSELGTLKGEPMSMKSTEPANIAWAKRAAEEGLDIGSLTKKQLGWISPKIKEGSSVAGFRKSKDQMAAEAELVQKGVMKQYPKDVGPISMKGLEAQAAAFKLLEAKGTTMLDPELGSPREWAFTRQVYGGGTPTAFPEPEYIPVGFSAAGVIGKGVGLGMGIGLLIGTTKPIAEQRVSTKASLPTVSAQPQLFRPSQFDMPARKPTSLAAPFIMPDVYRGVSPTFKPDVGFGVWPLSRVKSVSETSQTYRTVTSQLVTLDYILDPLKSLDIPRMPYAPEEEKRRKGRARRGTPSIDLIGRYKRYWPVWTAEQMARKMLA
jgi:hypothetical protein